MTDHETESRTITQHWLGMTETAPEGNPVAEMLRAAWEAEPPARVGVETVTRELNADWLPFVTGSA